MYSWRRVSIRSPYFLTRIPKRSSSPLCDISRKYSSMVIPSGTGKSGRKYFPNKTSTLQRLAISTVFSIASGRSENNSSISSEDLKYCSSVYLCSRRGSSKVTPSYIQTRASWASKSSRLINRTSFVATTGQSNSDAIGTIA